MGTSRPAGPDFIAPRELEHPILPLADAPARPLVWVQPMPMRPAYELWAGETVVATLRYRGLERREALGCAAEGVWTLEADPLEPTVRITARGRDVGHFDTARRVLRLGGGERFVWCEPAENGGSAVFRAPGGAPVATFASELALQARLRVDVGEGHRERATLLAVVGCYHLLAARTVRLPSALIEAPLSRSAPLYRS